MTILWRIDIIIVILKMRTLNIRKVKLIKDTPLMNGIASIQADGSLI